jgi:chromosome segregation ATPase
MTNLEGANAMDQELIAYLDERFHESARHAESLHQEVMQEMTQRFEKVDERFETMEERQDRMETAIRHTQVMVEGLRGDIQLVAEGVMSVEERLRSSQDEVLRKLEEVQSAMVPYCRDVQHLDTRVRLLEDRAKREGQAILDVIRERFGKTARPSD